MSAEPGLTDSTEYRRLFDLLTAMPASGKLHAGVLVELAGYRAAVDELTVRIIADYRERRWSYERIGDALGMSKQGVAQLMKRAAKR